MLAFLSKISVTCFFASYFVVLVLELLRFFGKIPGRGLAVVVMMSLGLFTHVCYLVLRVVARGGTSEIGLLASWYDWSLLLALGLAICFLSFYLRRPDTVISLFFLPLILATIGLSLAVQPMAPFSRSEAAEAWRSIHGLAMAVGAGGVLTGFLAGIMYLAQSWRLKNKRAGSSLRLPTLETLARLNRQCLVVSTAAVTIGVLAGAIMNLNRWGQVGWTSGGVLFSFGLLVWLAVATCVEFFYAPASHGRKAFYLTLASLGFLVLALFGVLNSSHGRTIPTEQVSVISEDAA
ncbi:cytochrome c biogenesis protein CcsA [Novipirellula artificiosorum]|uniref:Cytochrome C assembly protein n=1 Tax=Novipirellula artificiosorum TaxID=2528016 RepID=A0A5C6DRK0_9BACT|nr:cytochrome c biogenesis protein CcsA [Novipirellula artificiosorum]TWU37379.1 Cytochrome C assembly protein [Novipirellula artificiosorum]